MYRNEPYLLHQVVFRRDIQFGIQRLDQEPPNRRKLLSLFCRTAQTSFNARLLGLRPPLDPSALTTVSLARGLHSVAK